MSTPQTKLTAQGQVSVPAEIRRMLGVGPGSILEWEAEGDKVIVRRAGRYTSQDIHEAVFASRPKSRKPVNGKDAIARYMREKHARR